MTEMTINKLPSKTWYWLHVNETKLPWDKEHTTELPEETVTAGSTEEVRFSITGEGRYSSKKIHITAPAGKQVTVFMDYQTEEKLAVTNVSLFSRAIVFFAFMAAMVGRIPSIPTIAVTRISDSS